MKMSLTYKLIIACLLCSSALFAQQDNCCFYRLELAADFGLSWNNNFLRVTIGEETTIHSLTFNNSDGAFLAKNLRVNQGDSIKLEYVATTFGDDISYTLFDAEDNIIFSDGPDPMAGEVYADVISCAACPSSISDVYVNIVDVRATTAQLNLLECTAGGSYLLEYDASGFTQGMPENIINVAGGDVTLMDLQEKTSYDFYVALICASGDTTDFIGPYTFETIYAVDVGMMEINAPQTACGLTNMEEITVTLQNFGANPQSLIPFFYSVNGLVAGVEQPLDGYFTGVLGKDSTFTIAFETMFDLSAPGEYEIAAWTEFEGDSDITNDTTFLTINHIPIIATYPYFENFEVWHGGWSVGEESENSSWDFGRPSGGLISGAASGLNAWVTNLRGQYNSNETSYLVSPCLDFSSLEEDPFIAFSLQVETENCCDEGWIEISKNGGDTWTRIGENGTGNNWYNNNSGENQWNGDGGFEGWATAVNTLEGMAGESDVKIRFVFQSDFSIADEGFGVDNIFISPQLDRDLVAQSVIRTSEEDCGVESDTIVLSIRNLGLETQTGFDVAYSINGETPVIENVDSLSIEAGQEATYTFMTPFNSSEIGTYNIVAWTASSTDEFTLNDSISLNFTTAFELPYLETFEGGFLPFNWETPTEPNPVGQVHGSASTVLYDELWTSDVLFEAISPVIGLVEAGDSLSFEYRFVNYNFNDALDGMLPTILGIGDSLLVSISADCGENYSLALKIDRSNHTIANVMKVIKIGLDDYVGQAIRVKFNAYWGQGDYYLDLDNIGVVRCPATLGLNTQATPATSPTAEDGSATVSASAGFGPYTYLWSNDSTDRTATGLSSGVYTVTVTDAGGCSDITDVTVDVGVNTEDIERLSSMKIIPNPTREHAVLALEFTEQVDVQVQVVNIIGQVLSYATIDHVQTLNYDIDLQAYTKGLYFVRVLVDNQIHTEKLVKN